MSAQNAIEEAQPMAVAGWKQVVAAWWKRNAPATPWEWLSFLAIFGAAVTTSLVVDFATSTSPWLIGFTSLTCMSIALTLVVGLSRGGWLFAGLIVLSILSTGVSWHLLQKFVHADPSASLSVPFWLSVSSIATFAVAGSAVVAFFNSEEDSLNPEITTTNNGVSLIGVLASALAFNLPNPWGQWIGWPVIALTLFTLWPVFKNEDEATKNGADAAAKNQTDANNNAAAAAKNQTDANNNAAAAAKNQTDAAKLKFMAAALAVTATALSLLSVAAIRKAVNEK